MFSSSTRPYKFKPQNPSKDVFYYWHSPIQGFGDSEIIKCSIGHGNWYFLIFVATYWQAAKLPSSRYDQWINSLKNVRSFFFSIYGSIKQAKRGKKKTFLFATVKMFRMKSVSFRLYDPACEMDRSQKGKKKKMSKSLTKANTSQGHLCWLTGKFVIKCLDCSSFLSPFFP